MMRTIFFFLIFPLCVSSQEVQREKINVVGEFFAKDSLNGVFVRVSDRNSIIFQGFTGQDVLFEIFLPKKKNLTYMPGKELKVLNDKIVYFKADGFRARLPEFCIDDFFIEKGSIQVY